MRSSPGTGSTSQPPGTNVSVASWLAQSSPACAEDSGGLSIDSSFGVCNLNIVLATGNGADEFRHCCRESSPMFDTKLSCDEGYDEGCAVCISCWKYRSESTDDCHD